VNRDDFIKQFQELGFQIHVPNPEFIAFPFTVPVGRFAGTTITLAIRINGSMPMHPPTGPHISPRLLPLHPGNDLPHPAGGVHESRDLGDNWQYWSRPFKDWDKTDRSAKTYMAHINNLFASQ
jgi:hypothetical protein